MTATTTTANSSAPANNEGAVASNEVGMIFVHEYYTILNKEPSRLHCFYNKQSTMSHGIQGEDPRVCRGQQASPLNMDYRKLLQNAAFVRRTWQAGGRFYGLSSLVMYCLVKVRVFQKK